ncbi:MAG: hypothetical protein AAF561_04035 [Planctomycetota bacterium]
MPREHRILRLIAVIVTTVFVTMVVLNMLQARSANAQLPALAGGEGVYLMPGQMASNVWGVYVLDTDTGSLLAYRYDAGGNRLLLLAARDIGADRGLRDFNTLPSPAEIERQLDLERTMRERLRRGEGAVDEAARDAND